MLDINVKVEGQKVVINNLQAFAKEIPLAIDRSLNRVAKGIHREGYDFLSGAGAKASDVAAGEYPVPVRTGHLRRSLDWLKPGTSKTGDVGTFTAGSHEVIVYNSAIYANAIHEGKFSSQKHGPRRFLADALEKFNQGDRIKNTIEEEIQKEIDKRRL